MFVSTNKQHQVRDMLVHANIQMADVSEHKHPAIIPDGRSIVSHSPILHPSVGWPDRRIVRARPMVRRTRGD